MVVRNLTKLLFQRVVIVSLAILVQVGVILSGVLWIQEYEKWLNVALSVLSWVAILYIITAGRGNPSYKIAWIVLIFAFPVVGLTLYLLFAGNRSSRPVWRRLSGLRTQTQLALRQDEAVMQSLSQEDAAAHNLARYLHGSAGYPIYHNSDAVYFPSGEVCFARMLAELEQAEHYIFLEYFIIARGQMWDSILEILARKAARGVDVRVLYDDFGCITRLPANYCKQLAEQGIQARAFNPFVPIVSGRLNNRDHRKLLIVDGKRAFTGGINLADEYINKTSPHGHWKDCGILVRGEAAWSMTVMFLTMWGSLKGETEELDAFRPLDFGRPVGCGYVQPFADSPLDYEDVGATTFQSLIQSAHDHVWMMTPYLILDDKMTSALCVAAKTGVDVRIITPGTPDKWYVHAVTRANYEVLTEAGVRIFEYRPGFIHSKICLADDCRAVVGTVNMDFRSLYLHFEDAVYLYDDPSVAQVSGDFRATFPECREITYQRCKHVHLHQRLLRSLLRIFAPLM